ncbi:unnamed protein product [Leptidea sinapis]|uniref:EF-hand domain-containing protein n=1 Tax=Leptidea sinapis TaxID=189913 RepID=A0A5E4QPK1_9NEOP|nr:unnamed protein product [Leptidea sinapis]
MLHCLKNGSCFREHLIPRQTAMSEVATGSPVDEECLLDMDACYETFDKDGLICKALFRNDKGYIYPLDEDKARHIFQVFDKNGDGFVDKEEFVVEPINRLLESVPFDCVFYSLDWHPPDHVSFIDNVHMRELHPSSPVVDTAIKVYKGTNPEVDSYSVFWDNKKLTETSATIADALSIGYRAVLVEDASRGVDVTDMERTKSTILNNHGLIVNSDNVLAMVEGRDRRPELGYKLAMELKSAMEEQE